MILLILKNKEGKVLFTYNSLPQIADLLKDENILSKVKIKDLSTYLMEYYNFCNIADMECWLESYTCDRSGCVTFTFRQLPD